MAATSRCILTTGNILRWVWRSGPTLAVLSAIVGLTAIGISVDVRSGFQQPDELTEVPLMAAMFLAMVWHARRRLTALERLRRVSEANESLAERQRQFIEDASHELRTPITVALGHVELIVRSTTGGLHDDAKVAVDELMRLRRLSDRLGRRQVFGIAAALTGLLAFPAFWVMSTAGGNGIVVALAIIIPFGIVYAAVYGPEAALFSELFDTRVRYSGISFVYQFSGIFASGLTPIIATALLKQGEGQPWLIAGYMLVVGLISAACAYALKETAHTDMVTTAERSAVPSPGD